MDCRAERSPQSAEAADMKTVLAGPTGNHWGLRLMSMTSTRADDMTIAFLFFFTSLLEKPWEPCSQTACCLISYSWKCYSCLYKLAPLPLLQPVLTFPSVIALSSSTFSFFSLLPTSGPVLPWQDIPLVPVRVLLRDLGLAAIETEKKERTVHLPAGHIFKASPEWGLSGCAALCPCSPLCCELAPERLQPGSAPQAASFICFFNLHFSGHEAVSNQAGRAVIDKSKSLEENRPGTIRAATFLHDRSGRQAFLVRSSWTQLTKCSSPSVRNIHQRRRPSSPVAQLPLHLCISDLGAHHC